MAPKHVQRKFWWELLLISLLLYLLAGVRSQKKHEMVAAAQAGAAPATIALAPTIPLGVVATPLPLPLALK